MPDTQFSPLGTVTAPADWRLPPSLELVLKAAQATFDGTGAGGSFLPALQIVSDSGHSVGIYPCDTTIAAGSSCEVSFFPFSPSSGGGSDLLDVLFDTYPDSGNYLEVEASGRFPQSVYDDLDLRFPGMAGPGWSDFGTVLLAINGDTGIVAPDGSGAINIIALKSTFNVLNMEAWQWFGDFGFVQLNGDHDVSLTSSLAADLTIGATGTGHFILSNLPVVNPGGSGRVWNNAGVLSIT